MTTVDFVASSLMTDKTTERGNPIPFSSTQSSTTPIIKDYTANTVFPVSRASHRMAYLSGNLYMFGGIDAAGTYRGNLWRLDLTTNIWTQLAPTGTAPTARAFHGVFAYNSKIYILAGYDGTSYLNNLIAYDPSLNSWAAVTTTETFTTRSHFAYAIVSSVLYVIGGKIGTTNGSMRNDVQALNMSTLIWTTPLSNAFGLFSGASSIFGIVSGTRIYIYGGLSYAFITNNPTYTNALRYYDTANPGITTVSTTGADPGKRIAYSIAVNGSLIYVYGGTDGTNVNNSVYVFNTSSLVWSLFASAELSYARCMAAFTQNGSTLYIDDGATSFAGTTTYSETWSINLSPHTVAQLPNKQQYVNASSFIYNGVTFSVFIRGGKACIRLTLPYALPTTGSVLSLIGLRVIA